jgi:putative oxidoreductase
MSIALLIARLFIGLGVSVHGAQKLFGRFGGYGITGTAGFYQKLGFRPATLFVVLSGTSELVGGWLIALGLLGPVGPALGIAVMLVASLTAHKGNGFLNSNNGFELPAAYAAGALALAFTGPGGYSLDALLGLSGVWTPERAWMVIGVALLGALGSLALRKPAPAPVAAEAGAPAP